MSINEKLNDLGIKKILVVDDRKENLDAAKTYFEKIQPCQTEYASSAKEAIEKIQTAYDTQRYDLLFSDMQMEEKTSGQEVIKQGVIHNVYGVVVTAKDAFSHGGKDFGESINLIGPSLEEHIALPKSNPEAWKNVLEKTTEHMQGEGKYLRDSLQRYAKFVGKLSDETKNIAMLSYNF